MTTLTENFIGFLIILLSIYIVGENGEYTYVTQVYLWGK